MKAFAALSVLGLVAATPAPLQERDVQTVHLTFHGGPASYSMAFPADGKVYQTSMFFFHSSLSKIKSSNFAASFFVSDIINCYLTAFVALTIW